MSDANAADTLEMKLEMVPLPVSDVDRARDFYRDKLGFHMDFDSWPSEGVRVVQFTPPGSGCSVAFGVGLGEISQVPPGSVKGLTLVVKDVAQVRDLLIGRGVSISDIVDYGRGIKMAYFSDPDGNSWAIQEVPPGV
jgi:catechol 2,3-dioxygenase-like lactoylglutathione lyase family enzyme